jgi:two-component system, chemotaxis family, response regulator Rcp1
MGVRLEHIALVAAPLVLVIEDNVSDVFLLERALNKQDLRVELIHLADGDQALAFVRREGAFSHVASPSLILIDLNLPKHNGEDILREIRGARHLSGIPVCAWSSSQSQQDQALLMELGVARFVTKPLGLDQFMEIGKIIKDLLAARVDGC